MKTAMTRAEREAFLAETHVGLLAVEDPGKGPLTVPVWYAYEPGGVIRFVTSEPSRKVRLLRAAGRAGFCAQQETLPYRFVTVEGPVTISEPDVERDIRAVAIRYLGEKNGKRYLEGFAEVVEEEQVLVTISPESWSSYDSAKMGF
jgi:nitroimidazol reductase NimA-like FMN-containing flavoprotein (pyridoxamine 5'-phosphate oxidase superfamily)